MTEPPAAVSTERVPLVRDERCDECRVLLGADDKVETAGRTFCRKCHAELEPRIRDAMGLATDISQPMALFGAVCGAALGVALWWGVAAALRVKVGLLAAAIGMLVGLGTLHAAGQKRARELQILSACIACAAWVVAQWCVNRTLINDALAQEGQAIRLGWLPGGMDQFALVMTANFGVLDLVFLGLMMWNAWRIPAPLSYWPASQR